MFSESFGEISVCVDCMLMDANGEMSPDRPADLPEPWSAIGFGFHVTMGGEHNDGCPNRSEWIGEECNCEDLGFTQAPCEGCGDGHHGDRFRYTVWGLTMAEARAGHREAIATAIRARRTGDRNGSVTSLARAAEFRAYIADRTESTRRFARWMAAQGIAA
jgi:hypothetical protein